MSKFLLKSRIWFHVGLAIVASAVLCTSSIQAQTKNRVLIITGGHEFEREAFFNMFEDMTDVAYKEVAHPVANQLYDSSLIDDFDVLVFYDMVQEIDDSQKKALTTLLNKGKGVVFLHHALVSYQEWDEFEKIIGGRYVIPDSDPEASTYQHDVQIPVHIVDSKHPITEGMIDFVIRDEAYGNFKVRSTSNPLLSTTHPESSEVIAWTNTYGKSRIVYIQLGHDHYAYENPNYRRLISRSIEWVK